MIIIIVKFRSPNFSLLTFHSHIIHIAWRNIFRRFNIFITIQYLLRKVISKRFSLMKIPSVLHLSRSKLIWFNTLLILNINLPALFSIISALLAHIEFFKPSKYPLRKNDLFRKITEIISNGLLAFPDLVRQLLYGAYILFLDHDMIAQLLIDLLHQIHIRIR